MGFSNRASMLQRVGGIQNQEQLTEFLRDLISAVSFRSDIQDNELRTHLELPSAMPTSGTNTDYVKTLTESVTAVVQETPQDEEMLYKQEMTFFVRASKNYPVTEPVAGQTFGTYGAAIVLPELVIKVVFNGTTYYGRVALLNKPDEAVSRPLIGYTSPPSSMTPAAMLSAVARLHDDLVHSLQRQGILRVVTGVTDTISLGT